MSVNILQFLNNRELAISIWLFFAILWVIYKKETRIALGHVIKAFFAWKLTIAYVAMIIYTAIVVYVLYLSGIWNFTLITTTGLWLAFGAFSMLLNNEKANHENYIKETIKEQLKILAFLEFLINFYVFSLWVEIIIVPVSALIGGMLAVSEMKEDYEPAKKALNIILAMFGGFLVIYVTYMALTDFEEFATLNNLRSFILPIILTLSFLPFIYFSTLIINYETLFTRLSIFAKDKHVYKYARRKFILSFGVNLKKLNKWSKEMNKYHFDKTDSVDEALNSFEN